jgi:hypothetical protein
MGRIMVLAFFAHYTWWVCYRLWPSATSAGLGSPGIIHMVAMLMLLSLLELGTCGCFPP